MMPTSPALRPAKMPIELCDLVDRFGAPTGRVAPRGSALAPGEYYRVVHVWIRDEAGEYLVQQRAHDRPAEPGVWATTAGYVQAGEDGLAAALRETREELGLRLAAEQLRLEQRATQDNRLEEIWLARVTRAALGRPRPGPEVADWKWASKAALVQSAARGEFFAYSYLADLPG
jgi:8-oxo-dGTP pyrophosphatase MutT (NUDIX family)